LTKFRTHYDNLQISRSASAEVIKAAYRTLSAKYHPDRNRGDTRSAEIMSIINSSYAVLSDNSARRLHDAWIKRQEGARASRPSSHGFTHAPKPTFRSPVNAPTWPSHHSSAERRHWTNLEGGSAATEAALAQGRIGKFAALFASATLASLLVYGLLSEQQAPNQAGANPAPSTSVSIVAEPRQAAAPGVLVSMRQDEALNRALEIANAFTRSEKLLLGGRYTARIHDDGEVWLITYRTQAEPATAAPIVLLDKRSLQVIGSYARQ
jgi:hypothetical protein